MFIRWIKFCGIKAGKVKSEKGFTLLEVILVFVVMSILSTTLVLPFFASLNNGTTADIHATAAQLASADIEIMRESGFGSITLGTVTETNITINNRTYQRQSVNTARLDDLTEDTSGAGTHNYIRTLVTVTETASNPNVVVTMYGIISRDYN